MDGEPQPCDCKECKEVATYTFPSDDMCGARHPFWPSIRCTNVPGFCQGYHSSANPHGPLIRFTVFAPPAHKIRRPAHLFEVE